MSPVWKSTSASRATVEQASRRWRGGRRNALALARPVRGVDIKTAKMATAFYELLDALDLDATLEQARVGLDQVRIKHEPMPLVTGLI